MISASHNPIEWNALKFIGPTGLFLETSEGNEMRALVEEGIPRATWDQLGEIELDDRAIARHIERVLAIPYLDVDGIRRRGFSVALDCVRGAGAVIMPELLERLGCRVTTINAETDGRFPRAPEPVAENLGELERLVLKTRRGDRICGGSGRRPTGAGLERGKSDRRRLHARAGRAGRAPAPPRRACNESFHQPDRRGRGDRGGGARRSGAGRRGERRGAHARRKGPDWWRRQRRRDSVRGASWTGCAGGRGARSTTAARGESHRCRTSSPSCRSTSS